MRVKNPIHKIYVRTIAALLLFLMNLGIARAQNGPVCDTYTNIASTGSNGLGSDLLTGVIVSGNTIYASTASNGLSISTNGGTTFSNKITSDGLGSDEIRNAVIVLGNIVYAPTAEGLSISTDGGNTFTNKTTANGLGNDVVNAVYVSGNKVYAATSNGLSISTDGGASFTNKTTANGLGNDNVFGVYVSGSNLYAATFVGLSISTNGGTSFTNKTTANGLGSDFVYGVYVSGSNLYAATSGGLSISTDGGNTFTNKTTANGLGYDYVFKVYAIGNTIYASTYGGLSISTDGGSTFTNYTTTNGLGNDIVFGGVFVSGNTIYVPTYGGLSFCSAAPICTPTTSTETLSACGSYTWHGTTYTASNNTATWTGTNAAGCDSVVTLNLTINPNLPASVSIVSSSVGTICSGTSVTFTATPTNGGTTPSYQWKKNGTNVGTNSTTYTTTSLVNNDAVTVVMTSNAVCATGSPATSNSITTAVNPTRTLSVSIASSDADNKICNGASVTFTATANTATSRQIGGDNLGQYTYQWKLNGNNVGTNSSTYTTSSLANNDVVYVVATLNNSLCAVNSPANSNSITTTVNQASSSTETQSACSSYVWHGTTYTSSNNTATWTGTNASGCDSVVTLNLTINPNLPASVSIVSNAVSNTICSGASVTFTATPTNGGASPSYQWKKNGTNVGTNSATYTTTSLANSDAVTLVMTSNAVCATGSPATSNIITTSVTPTRTLSVSIASNDADNKICSGASVTFTASANTARSIQIGGDNAAGYSYQWKLNGNNVGTNSSTYTTSSLANNDVVYVVATFNNTLCTVNSPANSNSITTTVNQASSSTETQSACGSYVWHGTTYTTSGAKTWTGTNAAGCDSVVTLNLTINQATSSSSSASACSSYVWHGTTYTTSGAKTWTGTNAAGCDSMVTLNLTINQATSSSSSASACGSYVWHGTTYTTSGAKTWTGTNAAGCDSVVTLNLTINTSTSYIETISSAGAYVWHGVTYSTSTNTPTWQTTNAAGCDSIVTLHLTITCSPNTGDTTVSACGSFVWYGVTYTASATPTHTFSNAAGCDSVVTLNLTINQATSSSSSASACGSYVWHGTTYTTSGVKTWTGTNAAGCDSVVTLNLTIKQPTSSSSSQSACGSYVWHGTTYTTSGAKTWTGTNAAGCDSVVTLNLIINQPTSSSSSQSACGSYVWHGTTYTTSGAKTWTGTNAAGCDSVVTLNLTINNSSNSTTNVSICNNQLPYVWNNHDYNATGTYTWTGTNAVGCDSIVTLNLTVRNTSSYTQTVTSCGSYTWHGTTYNSSNNTATWTGTNGAGCDSVVTLNLTIIPASFPATGAVNGISNVCPYIGTNTALTYTAFNIPGATYTWTIPSSNVILVSGQGTNTIKLKFTNGFANVNNKQLKVKATTATCGTTDQVIFYLLAQAPVTPATIAASSSSVCASLGTSVPITYTIPKAYSAVSYIWSAQNGTTNITSINGAGANDTSVAVTFTSGFTSSNITVQSVNDCGVSGSRSLLITKDVPSQPGLISGPTNVCEYIGESGQSATYTVPAVANVNSYNWSLPNGAFAVTGQGTRSISFKYPSGFTNGTISVTANNGCGTGSARSLSISRLQAATPSMIDVINTGACPNRTYSYTLSAMPSNATSVQWTVPTGGTIVSGQGTTSITVAYANTVINGEVKAQAVNNCSVSGNRTTSVKLAACPASGFASNKVVNTLSSEGLSVKAFPNPTTSSFNLQVITADSKEVKVKIMDVQGRMIKSLIVVPYETTNIGNDLKAGVYMVETRQGGEVKTVRVVKY